MIEYLNNTNDRNETIYYNGEQIDKLGFAIQEHEKDVKFIPLMFYVYTKKTKGMRVFLHQIETNTTKFSLTGPLFDAYRFRNAIKLKTTNKYKRPKFNYYDGWWNQFKKIKENYVKKDPANG